MNCEEFELIGLDSGHSLATSAADRAAVQGHANNCSRCASLLESWLVAKAELSALGELTQAVETPSRVEMRLHQEFRTRHRAMPARRAATIAAWTLAAAAVLVAGISWRNWAKTRRDEIVNQENSVPSGPTNAQPRDAQAPVAPDDSSPALSAAALSAEANAGEFTLLPGAFPAGADDAAVVRVRMQRGALGAFGLPVNEERAGDVILVDLLVGEDGLPQAVKLVE
jgi:cell division septation protein DedD